MTTDSTPASVRLDKWLWAARFYKTRSLAKAAIESGHVKIGGDRTKVSKDVRVGLQLQLKQGWDEREIEVLALSEVRRSAPEAQQLYREREESIARREQARLERQSERGATPDHRPSKKDRRLISKLKRAFISEL